nr:7TM GPCR domain containing protein [Haemonchus contortus]
MTIISFPILYSKIWKFAFPGSVAVTILTPFLSVYPLIVSPSWFFIDRSTHCFDIATENSMSKYYIMRELYIFLTVFLIATSLVNCVSVILFCIRSKRHNDKAERNMFILALLDFLFQLTFYILFAIIYNRAEKDSATEYLVPYASDVVTFSNAYLLILLNKKIRRRVLLLVKCRGTAPKAAILVNPGPTYTGAATVTSSQDEPKMAIPYRVISKNTDTEKLDSDWLLAKLNFYARPVWNVISPGRTSTSGQAQLPSIVFHHLNIFCSSRYVRISSLHKTDLLYSIMCTLNCLSIHFAFVQSYMTFFVSLYRTTVIAFPVLHVKLWKYFFPCTVAITLLTPFIFVHPMLTKYSYYSISKFNNYDVQTLANRGLILTQFLIFMTAALVTTSAVNAISVILLCIRSKRTDDKAERNMFILAILDFFVQCSFYVLYVMIYKRVGIDGTADVIVPYASDLLTFSNAYLLLILNKKIRRRVFLLMKCRGSAVTPHNLQAIPSANIITAVQPTS